MNVLDALTENKNEKQNESSEKVDHWYDSNGVEFTENTVVIRVSDVQLYGGSRKADYGEVVSRNEDGTLSVYWDSAGCFCNGARDENPTHLTIATEEERAAFHIGVDRGYKEGRENLQADLRDFLGLKSEN